MKKIHNLTDDEIKKITVKVSKPTFDFFNKLMQEQIKKIFEERPVFKYDIIQITVSAIFDTYLNVLLNIKAFIEKEKLNKINFDEVIKAYASILNDVADKKPFINTDTIN